MRKMESSFSEVNFHLDLSGNCKTFLRTVGLYKIPFPTKSYCSLQIVFIGLHIGSTSSRFIFVHFASKQDGGHVQKVTQFKMDFAQKFELFQTKC